MALLTKLHPALTGTNLAYTAAGGSGDTFRWAQSGVLYVKNASGGSINVTIVVPGTTEWGQNQPDCVVAVADGVTKMIGPFPAATATDGVVSVSYSGTSSVTVAYVG